MKGHTATLSDGFAFVQAGSRVGYRSRSNNDVPCGVKWLDLEPIEKAVTMKIY